MSKNYVMAICVKCNKGYRSNGKSSCCQYCYRGVAAPNRSAELVAPHRCGKCGKKINTRECLGCLTLERIESAKKEPEEVSVDDPVALEDCD
jgi:hypothetical protein